MATRSGDRAFITSTRSAGLPVPGSCCELMVTWMTWELGESASPKNTPLIMAPTSTVGSAPSMTPDG